MNEIEELKQWLDNHDIQYTIIGDIVTIEGWGKAMFQNMKNREHLFKLDINGNPIFDCAEVPQFLTDDGINYVIFKFGDKFYYTDLREDFKLNVLKYVGIAKQPKKHFDYCNLGVHTGFELLNGSGSTDIWVKKTKFMGLKYLGICDRETMAGTLQLQKDCKAAGIHHVFGYSLTIADGNDMIDAKVYVQTQEGFQNLLRIQKECVVDDDDNTISKTKILKRGKGNVLVFEKFMGSWLANHSEDLQDYIDAFDGWVYFQVDVSEYKAERIDSVLLQSIKAYFDKFYQNGKYLHNIRPVLIQDCYYPDADNAINKIVLNKIADGAAHHQSDKQYYKNIDELYDEFRGIFSKKYDDDIFADMCLSTLDIAENADAAYDLSSNYMPKYMLTPEEYKKYGDAHTMFLELLEEGFKKYVPKGKEKIYRERLDYEVNVLEETDNIDYVLVQYDTINWARRNGIATGAGRGSAGGCLVLYLLGITLIDPIKFGLIFERFLLPERAGLAPGDTTVIGEDIDSKDYVELSLENGKTYRFNPQAEFLIKKGDSTQIILAKDLKPDDDIIWDNRDFVWTLNEVETVK